jgi:D-sedoheptulose 7-phosphate isomerase
MSFPNKKHSEIQSFLKGYSENITYGFNNIDPNILEEIIDLLDHNIFNGNRIYTCGNGGSSSIAEHFTCDFLKGSSNETNIQPIIHSLPSNTALLTAIANDISYDNVFSYQLEKYGEEDDVLIAISSSGNSLNIINALKVAKSIGMKTISFVGFDGGNAKLLSDYCVHIAINNYGIVEDIHQSLMHILSQFLRLKHLDNPNELNEKIF